ncbi:MFS transporter [Microbacterium sp. ASV81]|uniref:MFS transporter n=1 Tax=Microbacterium capsulatum TaxID=3041921 RepID=A0ABU0XFX3_9MICO|nr:MFS transporter [Microbacterium sp. ASV81]MDQ4214022.1 MFS transporter [Microbacterium sp. ASV81]
MSAGSPTVVASSADRRAARGNRIRLIVAQLLCGCGIATGVAVGGLLAEELSGAMGVAGFAQTASVAGAGLMAIPLARLATRRGRRWSLTLGFATAAVGALLILVAVTTKQFWLFMIAMLMFGSGTATNLQSRYAAMEYSAEGAQARSMSIVLWATTVGSIAGPNLSAPGAALGRALGLDPLSGPYLFSLVGFLLSAAVVSTIRPVRGAAGAADEEARSGAPRLGTLAALRAAVTYPRALFAMVAIVTGQMMMTSVMVMTPVSMNNEGMSLEFVGIVISVHIVGMYALSPVFGWLADRIGAFRVVWIGVVIFLFALGLGAWDASFGHSSMGPLMVALCLIGLGWSACLIGGSALLVASAPVHVRVPLQGASDSMMSLGAAVLAALAGPVLALGGFVAVNAMAFLVLLVLVGFGGRAITAGATMPENDAPVAVGADSPSAVARDRAAG